LVANYGYNWVVKAYCAEGDGLYAQSNFTTAPICMDNYEVNNMSSQARTINTGSVISAGISNGADIDWFRVTTPNTNSTNLTVSLSNLFADYDLYVYNKSLKLIGSSTASNLTSELVKYNSNARRATYYIMVKGKNGAFNNSYCYNLLAEVSSISGSINSVAAPKIELMDEVDRQSLYPNPASGFVNFSFNSTIEGQVNVQILNSAGKLVKQSSVRVSKGFNLVKIPVNDIRPGMYLLKLNKGEMNITKRFMKAE